MKRLLLSAAVALAFTAGAQTMVKSITQDIVERAVSGAMISVEAPYCLQDTATGGLYGRNGEDEFNRVHSLGVRTPAGVIIADGALRPWDFDPEYRPYSATHKGMLLDGKFAALNVDTLHYEAMPCKLADATSMCDSIDAPLWSIDCIDCKAHLDFQGTITPGLRGWIIWAYVDGDGDTATPMLVSYSHELKKTDGDIVITQPNRKSDVLGAIFVVPEISSTGTISLRLAGIVTPTTDGKWHLSLIKAASTSASNAKPDNQEPGKHGDLTPVKPQTGDNKSQPSKNKSRK